MTMQKGRIFVFGGLLSLAACTAPALPSSSEKSIGDGKSDAASQASGQIWRIPEHGSYSEYAAAGTTTMFQFYGIEGDRTTLRGTRMNRAADPTLRQLPARLRLTVVDDAGSEIASHESSIDHLRETTPMSFRLAKSGEYRVFVADLSPVPAPYEIDVGVKREIADEPEFPEGEDPCDDAGCDYATQFCLHLENNEAKCVPADPCAEFFCNEGFDCHTTGWRDSQCRPSSCDAVTWCGPYEVCTMARSYYGRKPYAYCVETSDYAGGAYYYR